ncbi:COP23 domain-containing protein [Cylindrospermopsis raciborskii]|uniref:COP23 domain-containing protein n=1 Tax=Cylindrospermopsis raciborskii TaxID=77022 RepID=UPI000B2DECB7|nr:COP23 domain-containing protein [Cylindrospermopsis raciborskii]
MRNETQQTHFRSSCNTPVFKNLPDDAFFDPSDPSQYNGTKFTCVAQGSNWATVGQRPGGRPIPIIVWTKQGAQSFGENYNPKSRCEIVTANLNQAVEDSAGNLYDVVLTWGKLDDGKTVICALSLKDEGGCDGSNTLFALKPENAKNPNRVLETLTQISIKGSSAGVVSETKPRGRLSVNLGRVVSQAAKRLPRETPKTRKTPRSTKGSV